MKRAAAIAALMMLGACGQAADKSAGVDKFAGLDGEILNWRQEILKSDKLCQSQAQGQPNHAAATDQDIGAPHLNACPKSMQKTGFA